MNNSLRPAGILHHLCKFYRVCIGNAGFPIVGKTNVPPMGRSSLKNEAPHLRNNPPSPHHWKLKHPSRKWFLEKNLEKSETVINNCVSIIKQHWKKMAEISQECGFITWRNQNFVQKVKLFVKKYYITWLITQFVVINIAPLTVLFCNCPLLGL